MSLEKSTLAANGHAMPMKRKVVIQSAVDLENTFVLEHMAYVSDSPEAQMSLLGMDFLAKFLLICHCEKPHASFSGHRRQMYKLSFYLDSCNT